MAKHGKTGVTANTPKSIFFGAGTIHKGLTFTAYTYALTDDVALDATKTYYTRGGSEGAYTYAAVASPALDGIGTYYERSGGWNFSETLVGATSGGSKLTITPEITNLEIDGAMVKAKGANVKTGETAQMEINFIELTKDILTAAVMGAEGTSGDSDYDLLESKADIETGDYWTNIAFVGKNLEGKAIIAIMDNALCTSGLKMEGKNKEASIPAFTFECNAELASDLDKLPWHIYYPTAA